MLREKDRSERELREDRYTASTSKGRWAQARSVIPPIAADRIALCNEQRLDTAPPLDTGEWIFATGGEETVVV